MIIFSSRPINNKFYRPSKVALLNSVNVLLNAMYVFERFLSLPHLVANKVTKVDELNLVPLFIAFLRQCFPE